MTIAKYNQKGYVGSSMSVRAQGAYEDGEMPKSKWTKAAILEALEIYCNENDLHFENVEKMTKAQPWDTFIEWKSWHHTGKFMNETDFYGLDENAVNDYFQALTDEQLAEKKAAFIADCERRLNDTAYYADVTYARRHHDTMTYRNFLEYKTGERKSRRGNILHYFGDIYVMTTKYRDGLDAEVAHHKNSSIPPVWRETEEYQNILNEYRSEIEKEIEEIKEGK